MITVDIENLYIMAGTTLLLRILEKTTPRHCHSCSSQFRGGGRRKQMQCSLTVCNKCYCQYSHTIRLQPTFDESEETANASYMDMDIVVVMNQKLIIIVMLKLKRILRFHQIYYVHHVHLLIQTFNPRR